MNAVSRFVAGPAVSGDVFYGREKELSEAGQRAARGMSTLFIGHRRIGKTSLLRQIGQNIGIAELSTALFLYLDAETIHGEDPNAFVSDLVAAIRVNHEPTEGVVR